MLKETIISIIIVIGIAFGNKVTQDYTKASVGELTEELLSLRGELSKEEISIDDEKIKEKINNTFESWNNRQKKLAYYIEHDELEKVETELTDIKSHIETKEYAESVSDLDKSMFLLRHIEDKYDFNLQNIF